MRKALAVIAGIAAVIAVAAVAAYARFGPVSVPSSEPVPVATDGSLAGFALPEGFMMSVYADEVDGARAMAFGPSGELLVSQPSEGQILALADMDGDGAAERRVVVASGLNEPHGLAFSCATVAGASDCDLYVASTDSLDVFDYDADSMKGSDRTRVLELPKGGGHSTRSLAFMPYPNEATLLISIGSSCNVCDEEDPYRATVMAYDIETGEYREFARGLRNSVFMEIHPVTGDMWATEMGRDGLGDDTPPDEVNVLAEGADYGWPVCYGKNVHDTDFDKETYIRNPCEAPLETPSHVDIQAHSAPLGLAFVPEEGWDESMWHDLLVAYHGSWNRSEPTGYKIVRMRLDEKGAYQGAEDFITGWLRPDGTKIGRPVDVKALPGGTMFITDDGAGVVYKVVKS